ncbi:MAG: hypothetical protein GXO26_05430, partial [Crenarchaeota archaeon]|nr:hypothetical protein [Thermoproteota archaeon]
ITKIPWIEKKSRIVILRPEGYKIQTIQPGITYKIEAPHSFVSVLYPVNPLKIGFIIWYNVTGPPGLLRYLNIEFKHLYLDINHVGNYTIIFKPYGKSCYELTIIINNTHICVLNIVGNRINVTKCDVPYRDYGSYVRLVSSWNYSDVMCNKVNSTTTICTDNTRGLIAYIEASGSGTTFLVDLMGNGIFKFKLLKRS